MSFVRYGLSSLFASSPLCLSLRCSLPSASSLTCQSSLCVLCLSMPVVVVCLVFSSVFIKPSRLVLPSAHASASVCFVSALISSQAASARGPKCRRWGNARPPLTNPLCPAAQWMGSPNVIRTDWSVRSTFGKPTHPDRNIRWMGFGISYRCRLYDGQSN